MNLLENDNFDNDDFIEFQLDLKTINLYYSQLVKYSKRIRDEFLFSDVITNLPQEIHKLQQENHISQDDIIFFFQLLQQNFNTKKNSKLTYIQCIDLLKLSNFFQVRKLSHFINEYIKEHNIDIDFIIQMIQYEHKADTSNDENLISIEIENLLTAKIDECLSNDKFGELPISVVYRIIKKSSMNQTRNNELFDFIKKRISKFCVLFSFVDIQQLSEDRLLEMCELYAKSDETNRKYFEYIKSGLGIIFEMIQNKKKIEAKFEVTDRNNHELEMKIEQLQNQLMKTEKEKSQIQAQLQNSENEKNQIKKEKSKIQQQLNNSEEEKKSIQLQLKDSENEKEQIKNEKSKIQQQLKNSEKEKNQIKKEKGKIQQQLENSEKEKSQIQIKLAESENEKNLLQKRLEEETCSIKGQIVASVKNDLLITAQIKLTANGSSLDTANSKYIISMSDSKRLGVKSYENGEPITSLKMSTIDFLCKSGRYFVHCIVFDSEGKSSEFVSNPVTTAGSSAIFEFEGKSKKISLYKGQYKLEVWGANGGDSEGERGRDLPGYGGLGGYSSGILTLNENETAYIFVGGEGLPANSTDGTITKGGFPDGGSTKTGHDRFYTSVPGTGGGSTSIRIKDDSNYARVIVAGGGGGASGSMWFTDHGGFGGGLSGSNCFYGGRLDNQGSGTQTGSTCGLGHGLNGDPGEFGQGATGKYNKGSDSGGGGWYGGGSGGHSGSNNWCSSGGGGSGWTFTESHYRAWRSGDPSNASKFVLNSSYYLTDAQSISGDGEFPTPVGKSTEKGHSGNGYAKITPQ